jgi:hypothetical protein
MGLAAGKDRSPVFLSSDRIIEIFPIARMQGLFFR